MNDLRLIDYNGHVPIPYELTDKAEELVIDDDPCITMVEHMAEAVADIYRLAAMFGVTPAELAAQAEEIGRRGR